MRAPLSIVIPTRNAAASLPDCLACLGEGVASGLIREVVISDGGSTDETTQIAEAVGARLVTGPASRGGQLQRGMAQAQGDWLLALHADTCLTEGWTRAVSDHLGTPGAWYFDLRFDQRGAAPRITAGWANLRARLFSLPYGDQGLLIDQKTYEKSGGYQDIPLMEDVALADALKGQIKPLNHPVQTSAVRFQQQGWIKRGAGNLATLARYRLGASPESLARRYNA